MVRRVRDDKVELFGMVCQSSSSVRHPLEDQQYLRRLQIWLFSCAVNQLRGIQFDAEMLVTARNEFEFENYLQLAKTVVTFIREEYKLSSHRIYTT